MTGLTPLTNCRCFEPDWRSSTRNTTKLAGIWLIATMTLMAINASMPLARLPCNAINHSLNDSILQLFQRSIIIQILFSVQCTRQNKPSHYCHDFRPSVRPSGTGMHYDHMLHFSADLSLWLDSPMFWAPWYQSMSTSHLFPVTPGKRGGVWMCKPGIELNANNDK